MTDGPPVYNETLPLIKLFFLFRDVAVTGEVVVGRLRLKGDGGDPIYKRGLEETLDLSQRFYVLT